MLVGDLLALEEVHGVLVELGLVDLTKSLYDLDLDDDWLSKWSALSADELKGHLVNFVSNNSRFSDLDWNTELEGGVLSDWEVDWDKNFLKAGGGLRLDFTLKGSTFLPLPRVSVLNFDVGKDSFARLGFEDLLRSRDDLGLLLSPLVVLLVEKSSLSILPWAVASFEAV